MLRRRKDGPQTASQPSTINHQLFGGSDWAQLEAGTFRFRAPLNKERRFIPLRFDDASIKGSLAQFLYINWLAGRNAVSLSSKGGEGQGEEAVALNLPARWAGGRPRWKRSRGGNREKQPGPPIPRGEGKPEG